MIQGWWHELLYGHVMKNTTCSPVHVCTLPHIRITTKATTLCHQIYPHLQRIPECHYTSSIATVVRDIALIRATFSDNAAAVHSHAISDNAGGRYGRGIE